MQKGSVLKVKGFRGFFPGGPQCGIRSQAASLRGLGQVVCLQQGFRV